MSPQVTRMGLFLMPNPGGILPFQITFPEKACASLRRVLADARADLGLRIAGIWSRLSTRFAP